MKNWCGGISIRVSRRKVDERNKIAQNFELWEILYLNI